MVYVRLNFDELLGRLRLIGSLGPILVNKCAYFTDQSSHFLILFRSHKVLAAFGCLHLEDIFLLSYPAPSLLILHNCRLQGFQLSLLLLLNTFEILSPSLGLLFVVLPLDDEAQVFLLQVREVLVELLRISERQFVLLVRTVLLEEPLQLLRVLNFVLGGRIRCLDLPMRERHSGIIGATLGNN